MNLSRTRVDRSSDFFFSVQRLLGRKYTSDDQQDRARRNCLKDYKRLPPTCNLILDDEKYFALSSNMPSNNQFYSSNPSSTPDHLKFRQQQKYEPHLLVWLIISPRGVFSHIYTGRMSPSV